MITASDFFSLLSDSTRLRCLLLLQEKKELCVCELCEVLKCGQPKVSRHLAILRQSGLVTDRRDGQWIYYRLEKNLPPWIQTLLQTTFKVLKKENPYHSDLKKAQSICCDDVCS